MRRVPRCFDTAHHEEGPGAVARQCNLLDAEEKSVLLSKSGAERERERERKCFLRHVLASSPGTCCVSQQRVEAFRVAQTRKAQSSNDAAATHACRICIASGCRGCHWANYPEAGLSPSIPQAPLTAEDTWCSGTSLIRRQQPLRTTMGP